MAHGFQLDKYRELGFEIARSVFSYEDCQRIILAFDELEKMAQNFEQDTFVDTCYFNIFRDCDPFAGDIATYPPVPGLIRRVTYPYVVSPALDQYRLHEPLLRIVELILGGDIVQLVNQANFNPPSRGKGWGWHQDYRFRRQGLTNLPASFVQCLLAVDSCSAANGGLRLVRGSDRLGPLSLDVSPEEALHLIDPDRIVTPELMPGDVVFFNPYVVHGSTANTSQQSRRVYINGYARRDSVSHGMDVMRQGHIVSERCGFMEFEYDRERLPLAAKY